MRGLPLPTESNDPSPRLSRPLTWKRVTLAGPLNQSGEVLPVTVVVVASEKLRVNEYVADPLPVTFMMLIDRNEPGVARVSVVEASPAVFDPKERTLLPV